MIRIFVKFRDIVVGGMAVLSIGLEVVMSQCMSRVCGE